MRSQQGSGLRDRLRFHNWPIATKFLVVSLGLAIVPLLIAIAITGSVSSDALTRQTRISLSRLSYSVAQRITQTLTDKQGLLQVAAGDPTVAELLTAPSPEARAALQGDGQQAIQNLLSASSAIDVVGLYNTTGTAMAHSDPGLVGRDFSTRDFVKAGLDGKAYVSPYRVDAASDTPGLNLSSPVMEGGQVVGVIAVRVKGSFITGMLADALSAAGQDVSQSERTAVNAYLVNQQGIVVGQSTDAGWLYHTLVNADTPELRDQIATLRPLGIGCPDGLTTCEATQKVARVPVPIAAARPLGETLLQALRADAAGSYRYCRPESPDAAAGASGCRGDWHIVGFSPVRVPSGAQTAAGANLLMAVVDIPENVFLQSVTRQRALGLGITAVIALLALLASLLLAAALAKPISRLVTISQEVEADKPFQPERIADLASHKDEVGHLARVYSNMVVALRARIAELRTIHEIGRTMNSSIQLPETLDYVLTAIRHVVKYDAAEICLYDKDVSRMVARLTVGGELIGDPPRSHAVDQGLRARMMQTQAAVLVSDFQDTPEADVQRTWQQVEPRAFLGVPLVAKGQVIGSIELVHREPGAFNQDNLRILESIAVQAAVAVQNAQEVQERENRLKQEIHELRIEIDEAKRAREVESIVGTEYFQKLREKARRLRGADREPSESVQP